jgi:hypothetical protein
VLELPKDETAAWVARAADAGAKAVWIHQRTDAPEALALAGAARPRGLRRHLRGDVRHAGLQRPRAASLGHAGAGQVLTASR